MQPWWETHFKYMKKKYYNHNLYHFFPITHILLNIITALLYFNGSLLTVKTKSFEFSFFY